MIRTPITLALTLMCALAFTACGDDDGHDHDHDMSSGGSCDAYTDGITRMGDMTMVRIDTSTVSPPDVGDNSFTFTVMDMDQAAVEGATVVLAPTMPSHGHGTTPETFTATEVGAGVYEVGPMDLFMPGTWQIDVLVTPEGGAEDTVTFTFCLEG